MDQEDKTLKTKDMDWIGFDRRQQTHREQRHIGSWIGIGWIKWNGMDG